MKKYLIPRLQVWRLQKFYKYWDLKYYQPDNTLLAIHGFRIRGTGLIDNIRLETEQNGNQADKERKLLFSSGFEDGGNIISRYQDIKGHSWPINIDKKPENQIPKSQNESGLHSIEDDSLTALNAYIKY